jgi:hypothetical protein
MYFDVKAADKNLMTLALLKNGYCTVTFTHKHR